MAPSFIACIGWQQMAGCAFDGRRDAANNGRCEDTIASNRSGFCLCLLPPANGKPPFSFPLRPQACGHLPLRCNEECGFDTTPKVRRVRTTRHEQRVTPSPSIPKAKPLKLRMETKEERVARLMNAELQKAKDLQRRRQEGRKKRRRDRRRAWWAGEADNTTARTPHCVSITSVWLPHLAALAPDFADTVFSRPLKLPLVAYYNGVGRLPRVDSESQVSWVNLSVVQPWAEQAARALPSAWLTQREWNLLPPCSGTARIQKEGAFCCWAHTGDGLANRACHDERTVYKVAAIYDAVLQSPSANESATAASFVLWLDLDTFWQVRPDQRFWRWTTCYDVATIGRKDGWPPETGIMLLRRATNVREMLQVLRAAYSRESAGLPLLSAAASANDVKLFDAALFPEQQPHLPRLVGTNASALRVGLFAVGCRRGLMRTLRWIFDAQHYKEKQEQFCPGEDVDVSPFNILQYLTHIKRGKGPVSFSSSANHHRTRR